MGNKHTGASRRLAPLASNLVDNPPTEFVDVLQHARFLSQGGTLSPNDLGLPILPQTNLPNPIGGFGPSGRHPSPPTLTMSHDKSRILIGDTVEHLRTLPTESVHCVVTSPPYYGLRDYGVEGQIGLEATPQEFIARLTEVFREVRRVLRKDGVMFLNMGDSYFTSGQRQTGRNDSSRETPVGRGGSFRGGVRRAVSYDTSGKEPEGYPASDSSSGSLCDACRKVLYRTTRNDEMHGPMPEPLLCESSPAHKESVHDHLPTLDSTLSAGRSVDATKDQQRGQAILGGEPRGVLESTTPALSQRPLDSCFHCANCEACLSVLASSSRDAQACARRVSHNGRRGVRGSEQSTGGMAFSDSAYPYSTIASLKPKDLMGMPWRLAFALQEDGWYLRQDIIWAKPNPMPESVTDRCTKAHEYLFLLTKSERYFFDADAIKEASVMRPQRRLVSRKHNPLSKVHGMPIYRQMEGGTGGGMRNKRSVWTIATQPFKGAHFATFPEKLVEPCILAGCPAGGIVLDPFSGSGTTGVVALKYGREYVGIELNPEYAEISLNRINSLVTAAEKVV